VVSLEIHNSVIGGDIEIQVSTAADAATKRDLHTLADRVHAFWVKGVLAQSLGRSTLMDLAKQLEPDAVLDPWQTILEVPGRLPIVLPAGHHTHGVFVEAGHSLLILGEPGSGKTTTLLGLAQVLLDRFRQQDDAAVPVVLNLATWSPAHAAFGDWVVEELRDKYQIPAKVASAWVHDRRLILLLDGLDETQQPVRASCVEAINDFLTSVAVPGIALCCRAREYGEIGVLLRLRAALRILPLSPGQISEWLASRGVATEPLRIAINSHPELGRMAEVPLMLSIMAAVAVDDPDTFAQVTPHDSDELRDVLFSSYVTRMLDRRGRKATEEDKQSLLHCLAVVARGMQAHSQSIFLVERLQPSWLRLEVSRFAYLILSRSVAAAAMCACYVLFLSALSDGSNLDVEGIGGLWFALALPLILRDSILSRQFLSSPMRRLQSAFAWLRGVPALAVMTTLMLTAGPIIRAAVTSDVWYAQDSDLRIMMPLAIFLSLVAGWPFAPRPPGHHFRQDITTVDTLHWSWRASLRGALASGAASFAFLALSCAGAAAGSGSLTAELMQPEPYEFALPLSLVFALAGALVFGSTKGVVAERIDSNQGMRASLRYSSMMFAIVLIAESAAMAVVLRDPDNLTSAETAMHALFGGLALAIMAWLYFGGFEVLKHYLLRGLLLAERTLPGRLPRSLNQASDLVLLRRVGTGYVFMHRLLLEYFSRPNIQLINASQTA
jgi:DNA polymerase III delta prime subunit